MTWSSVPPWDITFSTTFLNSSPSSAAYTHQSIRLALVKITARRLVSAKPLSEPMLKYYQFGPKEQTSVKFWSKYKTFHSRKCIWKYFLWKRAHCPRGDESSTSGIPLVVLFSLASYWLSVVSTVQRKFTVKAILHCIFLHAKLWIPGGEISIFTAVIH